MLSKATMNEAGQKAINCGLQNQRDELQNIMGGM
ncbi:hypothetical protein SAMN05216324_104141 [Chryseobacterium limigenitum]|uniref:Uncharacterized protein n=1 Tax=Chryseobacterium limigenitum TaxID=1612149 RepID=A0A1K2IL10_9FLAO|nr:hypothetical protein SAMN05216324_104141 [Chryseobacterium limigenitum]